MNDIEEKESYKPEMFSGSSRWITQKLEKTSFKTNPEKSYV